MVSFTMKRTRRLRIRELIERLRPEPSLVFDLDIDEIMDDLLWPGPGVSS